MLGKWESYARGAGGGGEANEPCECWIYGVRDRVDDVLYIISGNLMVNVVLTCRSLRSMVRIPEPDRSLIRLHRQLRKRHHPLYLSRLFRPETSHSVQRTE